MLLLGIFVAGFLSAFLLPFLFSSEIPFGFGNGNAPGDWINEKQIEIQKDKIIINIENASLGRYAATGSMIPVLDDKSNGIRIIPQSEEEINIGDIISFEQRNNLIIHRVIEKGKDEQGTYFITKGDNSPIVDGKIRFSQIKYVTIGVLW